MSTPRAGRLMPETREHWPLMTFYERFEHVVAFVLSWVIAVVIGLALLQLLIGVLPLLVRSTRWNTMRSKACSAW